MSPFAAPMRKTTSCRFTRRPTRRRTVRSLSWLVHSSRNRRLFGSSDFLRFLFPASDDRTHHDHAEEPESCVDAKQAQGAYLEGVFRRPRSEHKTKPQKHAGLDAARSRLRSRELSDTGDGGGHQCRADKCRTVLHDRAVPGGAQQPFARAACAVKPRTHKLSTIPLQTGSKRWLKPKWP